MGEPAAGAASLPGLVTIFDPEVEQRVNPAEAKHVKLMRGLHQREGGEADRDLKPNVEERT